MGRLVMKADGSAVNFGVASPAADVNYKVIDHPNLDAVVSAVVLVIMDEINLLRTAGVIGLTARNADDWRTKIMAKLP